MASARLPSKVLMDLDGRPLLQFLLERLGFARRRGEIIVATGRGPENDAIEAACTNNDVAVFRGPEEDVLSRYMAAIESTQKPVSRVVRVTADNPLTDPALFDRTVEALVEQNADYAYPADAPIGTAVDVFSRAALQRCHDMANTPRQREHINAVILDRPDEFRRTGVQMMERERRPGLRVTVDTSEDLSFVRELISRSADPIAMPLSEIIRHADAVMASTY